MAKKNYTAPKGKARPVTDKIEMKNQYVPQPKMTYEDRTKAIQSRLVAGSTTIRKEVVGLPCGPLPDCNTIKATQVVGLSTAIQDELGDAVLTIVNDELANSPSTKLSNLCDYVNDCTDARFDAIETDITAIEGDITNIEGDITTITSSVSGIETDITALENTVAGHTTDISDLDGRVTVLEGQTETNTPFTTIANGVRRITENGTQQDITFAEIDSTTSNPKMTVSLNGTVVYTQQINKNDIQINNAGSDFDLTDDSLSFVETNGDTATISFAKYNVTSTVLPNGDITISQNGNLLSTISQNADGINYNNTTSGLTADNLQDAIDEVVTLVGTSSHPQLTLDTGNSSELSLNVSTQKIKIDLSGIKSDIISLDSRLDTAESDIDNLQTSVTNIEGDVSTINTTLTDHDTRIDNLENAGFVESVTGNIVDNTDPQNPVVTQVAPDWNATTGLGAIANKPTIPAETTANNGLSVDGNNIVFGQDVGEAGDPAKLLSNREIPMDGKNIELKASNGDKIVFNGSNGNLDVGGSVILLNDYGTDNESVTFQKGKNQANGESINIAQIVRGDGTSGGTFDTGASEHLYITNAAGLNEPGVPVGELVRAVQYNRTDSKIYNNLGNSKDGLYYLGRPNGDLGGAVASQTLPPVLTTATVEPMGIDTTTGQLGRIEYLTPIVKGGNTGFLPTPIDGVAPTSSQDNHNKWKYNNDLTTFVLPTAQTGYKYVGQISVSGIIANQTSWDKAIYFSTDILINGANLQGVGGSYSRGVFTLNENDRCQYSGPTQSGLFELGTGGSVNIDMDITISALTTMTKTNLYGSGDFTMSHTYSIYITQTPL